MRERADQPHGLALTSVSISRWVPMSSFLEASKEVVRHERAMSSLCERTGAPLAEVRRLFAQELSRIEPGAKVRSYLAVLTASKVRAMLRRKDA